MSYNLRNIYLAILMFLDNLVLSEAYVLNSFSLSSNNKKKESAKSIAIGVIHVYDVNEIFLM